MNKKLDEIPKPIGKQCQLCSHVAVCSIYTMFKQNIEPVTITEQPVIKAENLAWICSMYEEKFIDTPETQFDSKQLDRAVRSKR